MNKPTLAQRNHVLVSAETAIKIVLRSHHVEHIMHQSFENEMSDYRPKTKKESEFLDIVFNSGIYENIWYALPRAVQESFAALVWNEFQRSGVMADVAFSVSCDEEFPELSGKVWRKNVRQWFKDNFYKYLQVEVDKVLEKAKAEEALNEARIKQAEEKRRTSAKEAVQLLERLGYVVVPPKAIGAVKKAAVKAKK